MTGIESSFIGRMETSSIHPEGDSVIERTSLEALQLLKKNGQTQKSVARMLGLSRTTVQKYWSTDPSQFERV